MATLLRTQDDVAYQAWISGIRSRFSVDTGRCAGLSTRGSESVTIRRRGQWRRRHLRRMIEGNSLGEVVVIQPTLPEYRVKFFKLIADSIPLCLIHSKVSVEGVESAEVDVGFERKIVPEIRFPLSLTWQRGVIAAVTGNKPMVLVVGGNPRYLSSVLAIFIAKMRAIPVVVWGHSMSSTSSPFGTFIRMKLLNLADRVLLYYREEVDRLPVKLRQRSSGIDNSIDMTKIRQVLSSIDAQSIRRRRIEIGADGVPLLLTIGRLTKKANTQIVIRALACARQNGNDAKLVIIGDGPEKEALDRLAEEQGVADAVIWAGALFDEEEIGIWMKCAELFVYGGAVGLSLVHAFAYGLPVVISSGERHHNPESVLFRKGFSGATFMPNDPDSLARAIFQLLGDESRLNEMSKCVFDLAHRRLGIERMACNFIAVLEDLGISARA